METFSPQTYLIFGDLHGRVLPAFRFGSYWSRLTGRALAGLFQVGDLGYFPEPSRLDRATIRHAQDDPLELGTLDIVRVNSVADQVFESDPHCPPGMWFTAGNHEDFEQLERLSRHSRESDFVVDAYGRVRAIKDGEVVTFKCSRAGSKDQCCKLRVGAVWGVDGEMPTARRNLPQRGYIDERAIHRLAVKKPLDVLLSHDAPWECKRSGYGSQSLLLLIEAAQPQFAFFGHYSGEGGRIDQEFGKTHVYHLAGFELRTRGGHPETGSVGVLQHVATGWTFYFVPDEQLKPFTRHNWKWL